MAVWDSVIVNDELDLLEARLRLLWPVVDHFVVVEGDRTFTGTPKPLHVREAWSRFEPFAAKLRLLTAQLPPDADSPWTREHLQEAEQRVALRDADDDDLVLIGDVDEFPYPEVVAHLAAHLRQPVRLVMRYCLYRVNWEHPERWEEGTYAFRWRDRDDRMADWHLGNNDIDWTGFREPLLDGSGWHLSYLGDADAVRRKVSAFAHQELNTPRDMAPEHVARCVRHRSDLVGRFALRRIEQWQRDPVLAEVARLRPSWVDESEDAPSQAACTAFSQWVAVRRHRRTPALLVRLLDTWPGLLVLLRPLLLSMAWARNVRRRRRTHPVEWKAGPRVALDRLP